jgi:hypothetical protein
MVDVVVDGGNVVVVVGSTAVVVVTCGVVDVEPRGVVVA